MVHLLAKEYRWSKSQINEVYPEEASLLLRFIAIEKKDKQLQEKVDYYSATLDKLHIQHGDPEKLHEGFIAQIKRLSDLISIVNNDSTDSVSDDDDLPDFDKIERLKNFQKSRR